MQKPTTTTDAWWTLQFTYEAPIGHQRIDTYTDLVADIASRIPGLVQITEWFQILKRPGFETQFHMDCHRRPQVTAYHVQHGSTNFFLVHPLLGYYARFLWQYHLMSERDAFVYLLEQEGLGVLLVLEEADITLENPGQAHYVW